MALLGTIVNTLTVLLGSTIGFLFKKGIPERIGNALMKALGICTIVIGIQGALTGKNTLIMIISMIVGTLIGEAIDIDKRVSGLLRKVEDRFSNGSDGSITKAFISSSLLFCVGSMTIIGSLNAGLKNDQTLLYTKSMLDLVSSTLFASTMGPGVFLSAIFLFIYQGGLTLLSGLLAPVLTTTVITEMTCVGSLSIIATGLNLMGITDLKVMNYLPSMILPIFLCMFF